MGRGRGKGKKITVTTNHEDPGSGGEESLPAYKRKGRPQKPLKDEIEEEEPEKIEEEEAEDSKNAIKIAPVVVENGKKRKRHAQVKENADSVKEDNGVEKARSVSGDSSKPNGFRQNGSRRKSKPHRAAEAGVEWK